MTCIFDGCTRPASVRGWCTPHYQQWLKRGRDTARMRPLVERVPQRGPCGATGCDRDAQTGGLCNPHALQLQRRGSMELLTPIGKPLPRRVCEVDGCDGLHVARGLCAHHYRRRRPKRTPGASTALCEAEGCESPRHARGMCRPHYRASRRVSTPRAPQPPKPVKPRPKRKAPASTMPPGWLKPTPPKLPQRPGPKPEPDVLLLDTNPPTDAQIAATRRLLARHGALDLADMLGVAA